MRLASSSIGAGPPVVLLHGLFGRARNLGTLARRLCGTHRVISLDLRNHGDSGHAPGMAYDDLARDVLQTLADLEAVPAALIGHSMGGKTALMAALLQPALVTKLVVIDIAPRPYAHHNAQVAAALCAVPLNQPLSRRDAGALLAPTISNDSTRGFLLQNFVPGDAPAWRIGLQNIAAGIADIEDWPSVANGLTYAGPALFVAGGASDYILPADAPLIHALCPQATIETILGAGHWVHVDQAEPLAVLIENFLVNA